MTLSDADILKELSNGLVIKPFRKECLDGCGYDLHLGSCVKVPKKFNDFIDLSKGFNEQDYYKKVSLNDEGFKFNPGMHILATVEEEISIPLHLRGELHGKSTLARHFIQVHSTAGIVKPGWRGFLVLELSKAGKNTILLKKGMSIGYLTFNYLNTSASKSYNGKYQDQDSIIL